MINVILLGMMGPWQIGLLLIFLAIPVLIIVLLVKNSKNKAKADTLESMRKDETQADKLDQLEKLNQLRDSGALSNDEFEAEKKKILGK